MPKNFHTLKSINHEERHNKSYKRKCITKEKENPKDSKRAKAKENPYNPCK